MERASRMTENFHDTHSPPWNAASIQTYQAHTQPEVAEHGVHSAIEKDRPLSPALSHGTTDIESPELNSPGLESTWGTLPADKEVYHAPSPPPSPGLPPATEKKSICGLSRRTFWIVLALLLLVIVGLGAGLGAGLGTRNHRSSGSSSSASTTSTSNPSAGSPPTTTGDPNYSIGGALDPAYYSQRGAFNGSGLALASQSFEGSGHGSIVMYFQHYTGTIRWLQLTDGNWLGGSQSEIVAYDAKNGTPIAAVAYALNGTSTWHIFYIDVDNYVRQKSGNNKTSLWTNGTVNAMDLKAMDADSVGLQACWYGSFYGDADYEHSPLPNNGSEASSHGSEYGMHLWVAKDTTSFEQYGWREGETTWTHQYTWDNMEGHAGVGCYSWGPGTVTYTMLVNLDHAVEIWWKDTNTNLTGNGTHPINVWTNSSVSIPNVHSSTSLGYTNFLYAQMADTHAIKGYNISFNAENTAIVQEDTLTVQVQGGPVGLPGTHLSVSTIPDPSGGDSLIVFYQIEGDDITVYTRDMEGGQWTYRPLPIPNS